MTHLTCCQNAHINGLNDGGMKAKYIADKVDVPICYDLPRYQIRIYKGTNTYCRNQRTTFKVYSKGQKGSS